MFLLFILLLLFKIYDRPMIIITEPGVGSNSQLLQYLCLQVLAILISTIHGLVVVLDMPSTFDKYFLCFC